MVNLAARQRLFKEVFCNELFGSLPHYFNVQVIGALCLPRSDFAYYSLPFNPCLFT